MKVWIVNYYTSIPKEAWNPRYVQLAKHFMAKGWEVITYNSNYKGNKDDPTFDRKSYGDYTFVHVKSPHYTGNGFSRMWSLFSFSWKLYRSANKFDKPDVILHNIHPPFDYPIVWMAKNMGAKYIAEAWDSWPEDFVYSGLISARNPLMKIAYYIERQYYYHADSIIYTFLGAKARLTQMGWTRNAGGKIDENNFYYINNGVDIQKFDNDKKLYEKDDPILNRNDIFKIVYLGSISKANRISALIGAAELLKADKRYQFVIYGDGSERTHLEEIVLQNGLTNITFKDKRVPFNEVPWIVSQATVNVMNYERGFGRWGVSSGKLFMYLAAGKPIICNVEIKYDNVISDNNLGICKDIEDSLEFSDSIKQICEMPSKDYREMCMRVKDCAKRFDYSKIAEKEIDVINKLFEKNG